MDEQHQLEAFIDAILDAETEEQREQYRVDAGYLLLQMSEFLDPLDYDYIRTTSCMGEQAKRYKRCYFQSFRKLLDANERAA